MKATLTWLATLAIALSAPAQQWLDKVDDSLRLKTGDGRFRLDLSGLIDVEGYYIDQRPPGLIQSDQSFINPRATFFLDGRAGTHFYGFLQARLDRGFDPSNGNFDARLDEYLLRWKPLDDDSLNLQVGKFATAVGSWVHRHYSWDNPLITAPLPYENLTVVSDIYPPASASGFLARRDYTGGYDYYLPLIWGPVYTTGGSVFGNVGIFDYALDLKNRAISSRPEYWDLDSDLWRYPTVSGRIGIRPGPAWSHGLSFSIGPYLVDPVTRWIPAGKGVRDYDQATLGYDVSYAWRRLQLWGELFLNRFEVPNVGNADALSYYIEAKYKLTTGLFAAARWNQQISGSIKDEQNNYQTWDRDMFRIDVALGYRFTRHLQAKVQYSFGHRDAQYQQGPQLVALQATLKF